MVIGRDPARPELRAILEWLIQAEYLPRGWLKGSKRTKQDMVSKMENEGLNLLKAFNLRKVQENLIQAYATSLSKRSMKITNRR